MLNLIPKPASLISHTGEYLLQASTTVSTESSNPELKALAEYRYGQIQIFTGWKPAVEDDSQNPAGIRLHLDPEADLGEEGYELSISEEGVRLGAKRPAGLFYAI